MTAYDAVTRIVGLPEGLWWLESGPAAVLMRGEAERLGSVVVREGRYLGVPCVAVSWTAPCGNLAGVVRALSRGQSASCPAPKEAR